MRLIKVKEKDYNTILKIWEKSVVKTHDFFKEEDRMQLKNDLLTYLKYVDAYLWFYDKEVIGFSGINDENLEMLFIDPKHFNKGYGTIILQSLIQEDKIQYVDVNKDNQHALKFYIKNGFKAYSESQKDNQGRDYPILHLKLA